MPVDKKTKHTILIVVAITVVILIIYFIVLFECYRNGTFIFADKDMDILAGTATFNPTGEVTQLTQDEFEERQELINNILISS